MSLPLYLRGEQDKKKLYVEHARMLGSIPPFRSLCHIITDGERRQNAFREALARTLCSRLIRAKVHRYITRSDRHNYGFTTDNRYYFRDTRRIALELELTGGFLLPKTSHPSGDDRPYEGGIIFGYEQPPQWSGFRKDYKHPFHFFTERSVDGFDALYRYLYSKGNDSCFKGKPISAIVAMAMAREKTYNAENRWWVYAEKRTIPTLWSTLLEACFRLSEGGDSTHEPAVQHFLLLVADLPAK